MNRREYPNLVELIIDELADREGEGVITIPLRKQLLARDIAPLVRAQVKDYFTITRDGANLVASAVLVGSVGTEATTNPAAIGVTPVTSLPAASLHRADE